MDIVDTEVPAHKVFNFGDVTFSSNFDNGNLARVEQVPNKSYDFRIWTAPDNMGTEYQSKHCAWYYFMVTGLPQGCVLRIQIVNTSNHSGLYKYDMRPVYRSNATNQKWLRIKSSVRFSKDSGAPQLFFEHGVEVANDKLFFSFTYPYTYTMVQNELAQYDSTHTNILDKKGSIFYHRELVTRSLDGRRIDLLTISSVDGISHTEKEPLLSGLFPDATTPENRPSVFPDKEVVFVSARVHPGEVPAQHTFKGILSLLMDPNDLRAKELRARYVFKLIPMLNPDGVYRGHFRMDQVGQNLNRYYINSDPMLQPAVFAAKSLTDYFASVGRLSVYLDFHAHASKRGCFIYGNVLDTAEDQIQNQLYCKLIALNSAHFDYEGCLFSKDHMTRIDPGDQAKGLTAEGSGRVSMYLAHKMIHSYTIECNYNTSRVGNEIAPPDTDPCGEAVNPPSAFTTNPEKYTPSVYAGVGRACVIALLDIRGHNPCSRLSKSKFKTLDRVRNSVMMEVRSRKDYIGKAISRDRRRSVLSSDRRAGDNTLTADDMCWRRIVESAETANNTHNSNNNAASTPAPPAVSQSAKVSGSAGTNDRSDEIFFIPMKEPRRRRSLSGATGTTINININAGINNSTQPTAPSSAKPENGRTTTPRSGGHSNVVPPKSAQHVVIARVQPHHVGDNTCVPTNALTPRLARRGTEHNNQSHTDRNTSSELSRDSSRSRVSPSPVNFSECMSQPDSRSSTPSASASASASGSAAPPNPSMGYASLGIAGSSSNLAVKEHHNNNNHNNSNNNNNNNTPMLYPSAKKIAPNLSSSHSTGSGGGSGSVHSGTSASNGNSTGASTSKVGRNILGKKLSAAGVALLMGSNSSFGSLEDALRDSSGGEAEVSKTYNTLGGEIHSHGAQTQGRLSGVSGGGLLPHGAHSVGDALDSLAGLLPHRAATSDAAHSVHHSHYNTHGVPVVQSGAHSVHSVHGAHDGGVQGLSPRAASAGQRSRASITAHTTTTTAETSNDFASLTLEDVRRDNYSISTDHSPRLDPHSYFNTTSQTASRPAEHVPPHMGSPIKSIRSPKQSPN